VSQTKPKLLIIEDDPGLQKQLRWSLDAYEVVVAGDREAALAQIRRHEPAVVTMDLGLPPDPDGSTEGLATLQQILALAPDTRVIVLTGNQDHNNAVKAIGMGAYDFHQKPVDPEVLNLVIQRAFFLHNLQEENRRMQQSQADSPLSGVISRDPGMLKVCRTVEKVAPTSASVMLLGESGTGFFLDEVGDLPMPLQAKLLRFLQERVIERIGGHEEIAVDVRIVCATHQKLKDLCAQGRFREDLYYRLSEIVVTIPPMRQREGDAALLAHHFKNKFCSQESRSSLHFAPDALAAIEAYAWPGNVREMENCIKRAVIMADGSTIVADDLGLPEVEAEEAPLNLRQVRDEAEYKAIVKALARVDGNIVKASEMLGISRPTMYDLMGRHGIKATA
jgi:DNA-binding NtrC family response regulator